MLWIVCDQQYVWVTTESPVVKRGGLFGEGGGRVTAPFSLEGNLEHLLFTFLKKTLNRAHVAPRFPLQWSCQALCAQFPLLLFMVIMVLVSSSISIHQVYYGWWAAWHTGTQDMDCFCRHCCPLCLSQPVCVWCWRLWAVAFDLFLSPRYPEEVKAGDYTGTDAGRILFLIRLLSGSFPIGECECCLFVSAATWVERAAGGFVILARWTASVE